ncbi:MAG: DUF3540 domain-containing protein [Polyangiaceae bacterium]|nr:DUF3540 domain-containing protein [Polyangiaceae bacterium]
MSKRTEKEHAGLETGGPMGGAMPAIGEGTWLRPAQVVATTADSVRVTTADGRIVSARLALALPYEPAIGDELLLLGDASSAYVVGVLRGSGQTRLALEGDVALSASGRLELRGGTGVAIDAPEVQVRATRVGILASRMTEIYDTVRTTVRELLSVRAAEQRTLVDGTSHLQAKNARVLSEAKVTINGKEIFLG